MRKTSSLLLALAGGLSLGFMAGCQTYDFEPVTPLAVGKTEVAVDVAQAPLKPNMMLLVDKSGSMDLPIANNASCGGCLGDNCPQDTCPTRWAEMEKSMQAFLTDPEQGATIARYGLAMFPEPDPSRLYSPGQCHPTVEPRLNIPTDIDSDDPNELAAAAGAAFTVISGIRSPVPQEEDTPNATATGGGTPTSKSLRAVGALPALNDPEDGRSDIIVLLTDGQPNCNPENVISFSQDAAACRCTVAYEDGSPACDNALYNKNGCLDASASVDVVRSLNRDKKIKTIIIGFGAETTGGQGAQVMNEMAAVGGFPRRCDSNGQCGGSDTCVTEKLCGGNSTFASGLPCSTDSECSGGEQCLDAAVCSQKFYAAKDSTELSQALREIATAVGADICEFGLNASSIDKDLLVVKLNEERLAEGADTWLLEEGKVVFQGAACETIKKGNLQNPAKVSIQLVTAG